MRTQDFVRLFVLAAVWGASFLFFRILAPVLGIWFTADSRVMIAGIALTAWMFATAQQTLWRTEAKHLITIGVLNSAIPFVLFAYAALHIPAAYSAILNALTPLFGLLAAAIWLGEPLTRARVCGLALGIAGVALVANPWQRSASFVPDDSFWFAIAACVLAALCYGLTGVYIKRRAAHVAPSAIAAGSQLSAGFALLPFAITHTPPATVWTPSIVSSMLALALICSAFAYVLYFRLIRDVGPSRTLAVTLLIPLFGALWGFLFLSETPTLSMLLGCVLILGGTWLAVRR